MSEPRFCYYLLRLINRQPYNEVSGGPNLSKETIEKIPLYIPNVYKEEISCSILESINSKLQTERHIVFSIYDSEKVSLEKIFR